MPSGSPWVTKGIKLEVPSDVLAQIPKVRDLRQQIMIQAIHQGLNPNLPFSMNVVENEGMSNVTLVFSQDQPRDPVMDSTPREVPQTPDWMWINVKDSEGWIPSEFPFAGLHSYSDPVRVAKDKPEQTPEPKKKPLRRIQL